MKHHLVASGKSRAGFSRLAAQLGGGVLLAALAVFPASPGLAAQATVAWDAVPDGGGSTIMGYTVHHGRSSGGYDVHVDVGLATATTLSNLEDGAVYFVAVSAYDQFGQEGALSGETVFGGGVADSDGDGILDLVELAGCTSPQDKDTDDDGIPDGVEDANRNGQVEAGETDPCALDTDGDGIQDGTELGYTLAEVGAETGGIFQPDLDPSTVTLPLVADTDGDGLPDGVEDANRNGMVDPGETDPCVAELVPLFSEDFTDGAAAGDPDWSQESGVWSVTKQGVYVSASPFNNLTLVSDPALEAFATGRIETKIRLPKKAAGTPNAFVVFNYVDETTYRYVKLTPGRITVGQAGDFPGEASGVKATRRKKIRKNKWYRLRIDIDPTGAVAVHVNGRTSPALTCAFPSAEPGAVGYRARKSASRFDDLKVWSALALP